MLREWIGTTVIFLTAGAGMAQGPNQPPKAEQQSQPQITAVRHQYKWKHEKGRSLSLFDGERTIWSFRFATEDGCPYFHPVFTSDGTLITAFAPADHPWHYGIWFSWKYLNGVNYWDWGSKKPRTPPLDGQTRRVTEETVKLGPGASTIAFGLEYSLTNKVVLREDRHITVTVPRTNGSYTLDWEQMFTAADADVKCFGHYGTICFRGGNSMRDYRVIDSEGRGKPAKGWESGSARWADLSGLFGPVPGKMAGVVIFDHPGNPNHPPPHWCIVAMSYGAFDPAFTNPQDYVVSAGKSFTLRYRVLVHPGCGDPVLLEKEFQDYKSAVKSKE